MHYSRLVVLEVWHDPGLSGADGEQAEFMGEVEQMLEMPPEECVRRKFTIPLSPNPDKARRRVHGHLTFEYTWRPHGHPDKCSDSPGSPCSPGPVGDALLTGALEVIVCTGEDLIAIDWKGTCSSDPYVIVRAYPRSPGPDGRLRSETFRTDTMSDTQNPSWFSKAKFDVRWTQAGTEHRLAADMRQLGEGDEGDVNALRKTSKQAANMASNVLTDTEKQEFLENTVPSLQEEIVHLQKFVVPQLKSSILDVKQDLKQIADALRQRHGPPREGHDSVHSSSSRHNLPSSRHTPPSLVETM